MSIFKLMLEEKAREKEEQREAAVQGLVEALEVQKKMMANLMAKGNIDWGHTFGIDFGLMNEALIKNDQALADWDKFK